MTYPHYTPQELCDAIYQAVSSAGRPLSRLEICRAIGRHKSPHILAMIQSLLEQEYFVASWATSRQGKPMFVYEVSDRVPDCAEIQPVEG